MYSDAAAGNVARHYSDRRGQTLQERKRSDIFLLRELNNWVRARRRAGCGVFFFARPLTLAQVKAVLIREFTPRGAFVLVRAAAPRRRFASRAR